MQIYVVNELNVLTDNQFEVYNTCHLATTNIEEAKKKFNELLEIAVKDFNKTMEDVVDEGEHCKYIARADDYDKIEVKIETMDLIN